MRADKRRELVNSAYSAVADARHAQLDRLQAATLERFQADLATALETKGEAFSATAAGCEAAAASQQCLWPSTHPLLVDSLGPICRARSVRLVALSLELRLW